LATALLAALVVAGAAIVGMVENESHDTATLPRGVRPAGSQQPDPPLPADDGELATAYTPVLAFTEGERWRPVTVDSYLDSPLGLASMDGPGASDRRPKTLAGLDVNCPRKGDACWHLTIGCAEGRLACSGPDPHKRGDFVRDGAAYVRVSRLDQPVDDGSPDPFAGMPEALAGRHLRAIVQYWFFYRYDEWRSKVLPGDLIQRHEGDWEAVTVGVGDEQPLFVAYSAHCGGQWRWWEDVRVSPLTTPETHPLVAVGEGSHGNYSTADPRIPDWTSCSQLPSGLAASLSYTANIRERTDYAWQWYPNALIPVRADRPPMSFPGHWGLNDTSFIQNFAHHLHEYGEGPKSPPLQALWRSPLKTIFCGRYWHGPAERKCASKRDSPS
jgi:hypothetical protein